jgi:hypothetical protein
MAYGTAGPERAWRDEGASAAPQRIGMVSEQMMTLDRQASELRDLACAIERKFSAALRIAPPAPVANKIEARQSCGVPLAQQLAGISDALSDARATLADVIDRAEV